MSPLDEQDLTRALRAEAARPELSPLGLDDVKGTARGIQRRRRIATGLAAAAVVATVVPGALLIAGTGPAPDAPVDDPDVVEVAYGQRILLDLRELPAGDAAESPVLVDGDLVLPDGTVVEGPDTMGGGIADVVPLGDTWAMAYDPGRGGEYDIVRVDTREQLQSPDTLAQSRLAHDPATGRVAWAEFGGGQLPTIVVVDETGQELWRAEVAEGQAFEIVEPLGFDGEDVVYRFGGDPRTAEARRVGPDGVQRTITDGTPTSLSPAGDAMVVNEQRRDGTTCSAVVATDDGAPLWPQACDFSLGTFSPDGRFVSTGISELSGPDAAATGVVDARTGELVATYAYADGAQSITGGARWESASSLLLGYQQSDTDTDPAAPARYALLRVDLGEGEAQTVGPVLDFDPAFDTGGLRHFPR